MKKSVLAMILSITLILTVFVPTFSTAEELGELDLYTPEVYAGEAAVEAPKPPAEPAAAEASAGDETPSAEAPAEYAVSAPEAVPMEALVQTVALTGKKASAQMNVGDTLQITVSEGETGTFKSKKTKLATVNESGLVTALKKGTVKITFKPAKGKKRTLTIKIVDPYEPKGVSIAEGKSVTVNLGDALQLNAILAPETAQSELTWKSGKAKVASVDANGVVTALKEGKAKITVTTRNKKKAKITVKVVDPHKPSGVNIIEGGALSLNAGESVQLTAVLAPETARTTLTWKSSKKKVATVDANGLVTAVGKGKATITVRTANGKKAKCKMTVTVPQPEKQYELSVYYGANIHDVAKVIGGLKYIKDDWDVDESFGIGYKNKYVEITGYPYDKKITDIWLHDKVSDYSLLGLKIGMTKSEALEILRGHHDYGYNDDDYWTYGINGSYEPDGNYWTIDIKVWFDSNGQIKKIHYGKDS